MTAVFISAFRPSRNTEPNKWFAEHMGLKLKDYGFDFAPAEGVIRGYEEGGFVVNARKPDDLWKLRLIAEKYGQQATIEIGPYNVAHWVEHGERTRLGFLGRLTEKPNFYTERFTTGWFKLGHSYYFV